MAEKCVCIHYAGGGGWKGAREHGHWRPLLHGVALSSKTDKRCLWFLRYCDLLLVTSGPCGIQVVHLHPDHIQLNDVRSRLQE